MGCVVDRWGAACSPRRVDGSTRRDRRTARLDNDGDGRLEREYALGRGRVDLLILWPQEGRERRIVVECKVRRGDLERTIAEGLAQMRGYLDRCGAESGHLIIFDRTPQSPERSLPALLLQVRASV